MGEVSTIGLDIAKSVFQVHGADVDGAVVIRKRVSRAKVLEFFSTLPACVVGIEACPSAHHWSRELRALGHTVRLMPPSYVKAYLKRSKNDANDAAAICEAVTRPSMRFVPTKSEQQQSGLMLHRSRQLLVRQRTMLSNAIRGHLAELGIISAKGRNGTAELFKIIADEKDGRIVATTALILVALAFAVVGYAEWSSEAAFDQFLNASTPSGSDPHQSGEPLTPIQSPKDERAATRVRGRGLRPPQISDAAIIHNLLG